LKPNLTLPSNEKKERWEVHTIEHSHIEHARGSKPNLTLPSNEKEGKTADLHTEAPS
jgi:hypothetical protein